MRRIILYHCYGGTHSSIIAANLHLGRLSWHTTQGTELLALTHFDQLDGNHLGLIIPHGQDEGGNLVCTVARRREVRLAENLLLSYSKLLGTELVMVNALSPLGSLARVGGFLSRRWGAISLGRLLLTGGCLRVWPRFLELVGQTRTSLGLSREPKAGKQGLTAKL
jgi:hypothetical protein